MKRHVIGLAWLACLAVASMACGGTQEGARTSDDSADPTLESGADADAQEQASQVLADVGFQTFVPVGPWRSPFSGALFGEGAGSLARMFVGLYALPTADVLVRYESPAGCRVSLFVFLPQDMLPPNSGSVYAYTQGAINDMAAVLDLAAVSEAYVVADDVQQYGFGSAVSVGADGARSTEVVFVTADATWLYKARITAPDGVDECLADAFVVIDAAFPGMSMLELLDAS